jgi:DEAD/DEAH box helicase domain-containing protein
LIDLEQLLRRVPIEAADAVVGMARLKSATLNTLLRGRLGGPAGAEGSVLSEPFIEGAFPWLPHAGGWEGLPEGLLHPRTLEVLRQVSRPPYQHQLEAWRHLCRDEPASTIVSSGTGSGKTECFLTPILDRLVRQSGGGGTKLEGVRALMLYPLNALISSQEERLSKWFEPFGGSLRYALYNGETPEDAPTSGVRRLPWKVDNRRALRDSPPPVLVTNVTMLEYMLIRQKDAPILRKSQDTLDFIVLDEAHSYVGAQAAEIALLLRRVALAFGRRPDQLRYVATSATIGDGADDQLRGFLKDLSGAPDDQVHVVNGRRAPLPVAPDAAHAIEVPAALRSLSELESGRHLAASRPLRAARERLRDGEVMSWSAWTGVCGEILERPARDGEAVELLVESARARDPGADEILARAGADNILPIRVHLFHGTLTGLWACISPDCPGRPDAGVENADWPYGAVFAEHRTRCPHCESLVLEWAFCGQCGDGALKAEEYDGGARVAQWTEPGKDDEFEQTLQLDETFGEEAEDGDEVASPVIAVSRRYLVASSRQRLARVRIDRRTGIYAEGDATDGAEFLASTDLGRCPCCDVAPPRPDLKRGVLRSFVAGAPFLMSQIAPGLLAHLSPRSDIEAGAPFQGRQLITFTDARQGTARHAANIQIAAERAFVRGFLYHTLQERKPVDPAALALLNERIGKLEPHESDPTFAAMLRQSREEKEALVSGGGGSIPWPRIVESLANDPTLKDHLRQIWRERDERFQEPRQLAEFLLYREIMRRPVRANSAETLGLARFVVPGVDGASALPLPGAAAALGLSASDWGDLIRLLLTHFVRTNVALQFDHDGWMPWIDRRQVPIEVTVRQPDSVSSRYVRFWPSAKRTRPTRVVRVLCQALGLSLDDAGTRDRVDELLGAAWTRLQRFTVGSPNGVRFKLDEFELAPVETAFACPVTRRIVDTTFRGLSPYDRSGLHEASTPVRMPRFPYSWRRDAAGAPVDKATIDEWLATDPDVAGLKRLGVWGDQQERAVRLTPWLRAAEHSAQQPGFLLRQYEDEFKRGQINVLGCSTTMEMGVDIGSIEAVLNTNAPPAIANYRQRVGRAGRQRQPISVGLTLCKDRPLDRAAFADPEAFLNREVRAPKVSLESPTIARRQANAYLLARFLSSRGSELHKLTNGAFFGLGREPEGAGRPMTPANEFLQWLDRSSSDDQVLRGLGILLAGTPLLEGTTARPDMDLWASVRDQMETVAAELSAEWEALQGRSAAAAESTAGRPVVARARDLQRERLERGYLLSELAGRGFLPSYGFPTDVVQFATETQGEKRKRKAEDENRISSRGYPSRSRDVAIFEYAPGRSIVVDGVVRESAGVTLNWKRPISEEGVREVQNLRVVSSCGRCGALWSSPTAAARSLCPECGWNEPKSIRFLSPGGFAVANDFKIHDDPSDLGASSPVDPWVSARGGAWRALPNPDIGRFRASPTGLVFWFNPGPYGHGFGVCLHCGRAEAETEADGGQALPSHRPLRGWPRNDVGGLCTGTPEINPFAVQRRLRLGHEIRTDVCEVQLYDCASATTALAIALALREAIARRLGVDADEMGFAAPPAADPLGSRRSWSAVIFDRASGGAGFSSTLAENPIPILREARALLDCEAVGRCGDCEAVTVCPLCVLGADSQHSAEDTDRKAAFALLTDALARLTLPEEHRIFGASSEFESAPLAVALAGRLQGNAAAALTLFLSGRPDDWDLDEWPMTPVLDLWGGRGRKLAAAVDSAALATADPVTRRRVVLWARHARLDLVDNGGASLERPLLATIDVGGAATSWGSARTEAAQIGPTWAAVSLAPIVRGNAASAAVARPVIDPEGLLREQVREAVFEVGAELDGSVAGFGARFRELLRAANPDLSRAFDNPCTELTYTDRYLLSPLTVRLLGELLTGFAGPSTRIQVRTLAVRPGGEAKGGMKIDKDWRSMADRDLTLRTMLGAISPLASLETSHAAPHRRRLDFKTSAASGTIFFDQGVGSWRTASDTPFDFGDPPSGQIEQMKKLFEIVNNPHGTFVAVRLDAAGAAG